MTNLITQPDGTGSLTNWSAVGFTSNPGTELTPDVGGAYIESSGVYIRYTDGSNIAFGTNTGMAHSNITVQAGQQYDVAVTIGDYYTSTRSDSYITMYLVVEWRDSSDVFISQSYQTITYRNTTSSIVVTAPTGAAFAKVAIIQMVTGGDGAVRFEATNITFAGYVPPNTAPVANAGSDVTVSLTSSGTAVVYLSGTVTDDNHSQHPVSTSWSQVSGISGVIENYTQDKYRVTFTQDGTAVLRFTADDGEYTDSDDITITINEYVDPLQKPQGTNLVHQSVATQGMSDWQVGWSTSMYNTGFDFTADGEWFHFYRRGDGGQEPRTYYFANTQTIPVEAGSVYTFYLEAEQPMSFSITPNVGGAASYPVNAGINKWSWTAPTGATSLTFKMSRANVAAYSHIRFKNVYIGEYVPNTSDTNTPPAPPATPDNEISPWDIRLQVEDPSESTGLENLLVNASGREGAFGWSAAQAGPTVSTTGEGDWTFLRFTAYTQASTYYQHDYFEVTPTFYAGIRVRWGGFSAGARIGISLDYFDGAMGSVGSTSVDVVDPSASLEYQRRVQIPSNAEYARLRFTQYRDGGSGNTVNPWGGDYFEGREITVIESVSIDDVDDIQSWQAETQIAWKNILADSHEIGIDRSALDAGLMSATIIKDGYDPAIGGFLAPGAAVRVQVRDSVTEPWQNIFQGTLTNVKTAYPFQKTTEIFITANDSLALLANQPESRGIYDVDNLPLILSNKGVKWSVNGVVTQVSSAPIASLNENASVLDQIVISRDSDKAYAWIDANDVLQVWNRSALPTAPEVTFSDQPSTDPGYDSFMEIDASFDTSACINIIDITYVRSDGTEVKYGPYTDATSIKKWGAYRSTFTVHGIAESEANMAAFANEVFANNANPEIKANSIAVPIKDARGRAHVATVDLYSLVRVIYQNRIDDSYRVTGIKHEITPDLWTVEYTFEKGDSVAVPVWTPSTNA